MTVVSIGARQNRCPDVRQQLIAIRYWRGLSQTDVATRMCVGRGAVARFEASHHSPTLNLLERYAKAVGAEMGAWPAYPNADPDVCKRPPSFRGEVGP